MPVRTSAPLGAPTWIDLATSDLERAQQFYGAVFGWTFEAAGPEYGGYVNAFCSGQPVAGLMVNDPQYGSPDGWTTYLHTADIRDTIAKSTSVGGTSCVDPMQIGDRGWMGMLSDPSGAFFGLWQPTGHRGFEVVDEHGAPVFHQLTTNDFAAASAFYPEVFGWQLETVSDADDFRYSTASFDGQTRVGVMDGQQDGAPGWFFFLGADDVDKTIELITAGGGKVHRAAEDTPYGRLAAVADPTGATFNLSSIEA